MANPPTDSNQRPLFAGLGVTTPEVVAAFFARYVQSGLKIIFWAIVASFACGAGYICLRAVIWAVKLATRALGI